MGLIVIVGLLTLGFMLMSGEVLPIQTFLMKKFSVSDELRWLH